MIEEIIESLASSLEVKRYSSKFSLLHSGGYDIASTKLVITLSAAGRHERFFVKLSNSGFLSDRLKKEAENLIFLNSCEVGGVPKVVASGYLGDRYFLAERFITGERLPSSTPFEAIYPAANDWLQNLYGKTETSNIHPKELLKRAEEYASYSSEFFDVNDLLPLMEDICPNEPIAGFMIHGDFWHGNMIMDRYGKLILTDFALASKREPPIDMIDLLADYNFQALLDRTKFARYSSSFLPVDTDPSFFILYATIRKLAEKVRARTDLYNQYLIKDLDAAMTEIREAGVLSLLTHLHSKNGHHRTAR
jgi:fructosamine-3-kinase